MRENKKNCGNLHWIKIYLETSSKLKDILETIIRIEYYKKRHEVMKKGSSNRCDVT